MNTEYKEIELAKSLTQKYKQLKDVIAKVIIGQEDVIEKLFISILCNNHSLLVGVPGLAKTLLVKSLSDVLDLSFNRIQFTPDLMPSDITGSEILDENRKFKFIKGPLFSNIILADEINRTPPKTQAALLEAMQEKSVTAAGVNYILPRPFFVLATQNPIEQEGTYPLPEAQLDRFMFHIPVEYPSEKEEVAIVMETTKNQKFTLEKIMGETEILHFQDLVKEVPVTDSLVQFAVSLVRKSRPIPGNTFAEEFISWGAGPRASQNLILAAKAHALLHGKYAPDQEDVLKMAPDILRHRILFNYKAQAKGVDIQSYLNQI